MVIYPIQWGSMQLNPLAKAEINAPQTASHILITMKGER